MPDFLDKRLVHDFKYAQSVCYKKFENIDCWGGDYGQYIQAFILYGDGPIIKGKWTSEEAEKAFIDTYELWEIGSKEISSAKRTLIASDIFKTTEPIWRLYADAVQTLAELDREEEQKTVNQKLETDVGNVPRKISSRKNINKHRTHSFRTHKNRYRVRG